MRVAIFSDTFPPQTNGVANVAYQSAKSLIDSGHEVMVFTAAKNSEECIEEKYRNIKIVSLPSVPALIYPSHRFTLPFGFSCDDLEKFNPHIIHSHTPFAVGWEAVLNAKFLKIPLVGTHHTFYDDYLKYVKLDSDWGKKISWKYTIGYYNRCDLVLSPTRSLADALLKEGLKKPINILQNSLDTDFFKPTSDSAAKKSLKKHYKVKGQSLIFHGRLGYEKSLDKVLKAFAVMLKKMPELKLMMVGDGPHREELERLAEELGIKNMVIFTGYVAYGPEIVKICQANDIYLTASKSENMPMSVLEAMATGLPIIAAKEKGLTEIIANGINGFFVPADDYEMMAEKTLKLLEKPEMMEKMGRNSRILAMKYSKENVSSVLEKFYKETMEKFKLENSTLFFPDENGSAKTKIHTQALKLKKILDKISSEDDLAS